MCISAGTILIWSSGQTCEQTRSCYSILQMRSERLWEVLWVAQGPSTDKWLSWDWSAYLQALRPLIFLPRVSWPSLFPSKNCFYISQSQRKKSSVSDTDSIIWALSLELWSVLAGGGAPGVSLVRWRGSKPSPQVSQGCWAPRVTEPHVMIPPSSCPLQLASDH